MKWRRAVANAYYRPHGEIGGLQWQNVNPSLFYHSALEVAKLFAVHLRPGVTVEKFAEFNMLSVFKIMAAFSEFHHSDQTNYSMIIKVRYFHLLIHLSRLID